MFEVLIVDNLVGVGVLGWFVGSDHKLPRFQALQP